MVNVLHSATKDEKTKKYFKPSGLSFEKKKVILHNLRARIICNDPSLQGLLTFVPHKVVPETHPHFNSVAFATSNKMYFGDLFFSAEIPIQCAIIIHEMFHIVFRHAVRSRSRIHTLYNIACDAIINDSIGYKENCAMDTAQPIYLHKEHCVSLDSLYEELNIEHSDRRPVSSWTSEELYEFLIKNLKEQLEEQVKQKEKNKDKSKDGESSQSGDGEGDGEGEGQSSSGSGKGKQNNSSNSSGSNKSSGSKTTPLGELEKQIEDLLERLAEKHELFSGDDLHADGEDEKQGDSVNEQVDNAKWTQRYNRAKAQSTGTNSMLGKVNPDVYQPQIPWYKELRKYLVKRCMPLFENSWSRPSRRLPSIRNSGSRTYLPGHQKQKGLDKMMVIIDTSGSCFNEEELSMFCGEIESIQTQTGVEIALIFADTEIKSESIVKADGTKLTDKVKRGWINPKGGGGTDMVTPFLEGKKKYKPVLTVIASDGYTPFPTAQQVRGTSLLWVINTDATVPPEAGKALYIHPQR